MKHNFDIPEIMKDLKIDERGYPIPYFVMYRDRVPDFRFIDGWKRNNAYKHRLCNICGKKLNKDFAYVISGPIGFKNGITSDPAMHRECAEFSLRVCPHLLLEKADRRDHNTPDTVVSSEAMNMIPDKPEVMYLVKIYSNYRIVNNNGIDFIRYRFIDTEKYIYVNGKLQKEV